MSSRPIRARIVTEALRHNFQVARNHAGDSRLWAVIKANAYGHGLLPSAHALSGLADGFALLELSEAESLRRAGLHDPILMLEGFFSPAEIGPAAELGVTVVVHSHHQLQWLEEAELARPLPVFLKVNTGMNRLGFKPEEAAGVVRRLAGLRQVAAVTLMTHFAEADTDVGIAGQLDRFGHVRAGLAEIEGISIANSATLLRYPAAIGGATGWARPGIMLYGASPFPERRSARELGLRPVMTLESELIAVQNLHPGDRVGYGGRFEADRPMRVGIVGCGYGDGYPRHAGTGTPISVAGRRTRTLGRVSMDMLVADITDIPEAGPGSPVVLWGGSGMGHVPADEVAMAAGTISYEMFCALAPRVPRIVL